MPYKRRMQSFDKKETSRYSLLPVLSSLCMHFFILVSYFVPKKRFNHLQLVMITLNPSSKVHIACFRISAKKLTRFRRIYLLFTSPSYICLYWPHTPDITIIQSLFLESYEQHCTVFDLPWGIAGPCWWVLLEFHVSGNIFSSKCVTLAMLIIFISSFSF